MQGARQLLEFPLNSFFGQLMQPFFSAVLMP